MDLATRARNSRANTNSGAKGSVKRIANRTWSWVKRQAMKPFVWIALIIVVFVALFIKKDDDGDGEASGSGAPGGSDAEPESSNPLIRELRARSA